MRAGKNGSHIKIYVDGASRGNPGPSGIGVVIIGDDGTVIDEGSHFLGERTNNQAEYEALIFGLSMASEFNPGRVSVFSDSELLVKQLRGEFRVKNESLKPLFRKAADLIGSLGVVDIIHVPRDENRRADKLANFSIDRNV